LLKKVVDQKPNINKTTASKVLEISLIVLITFVPFIVSTSLLYTDIFGLSVAWCWMQEYDSQRNKTNTASILMGGYSFLVATCLLSITLSVVMVIMY
jgi:hypothetical protein